MTVTALHINTDGTYQTATIGDDNVSCVLGCDLVDCVAFTLAGTSESIAVWIDDEGAFTQDANVLGTIVLKEVCDSDATEYFTYQHVLYGSLLITANEENLASISDSAISSITSKLDTYLNSDL